MGTRGAQHKFRAAIAQCGLANFAGKKLIWRKDLNAPPRRNVAPQARRRGSWEHSTARYDQVALSV